MSRLNDKKKGAIVLVMQRLHEEDLSGHLLAAGGWKHLCLPAIAPEDQHVHLTTRMLLSLQLPVDWHEQRIALRIA